MNVRKYHAVSAYLALILAIINTILVAILNGPSYLKSCLNRPRNNILLLLIPTLGAIFVLIVIIIWIKKHYYKDLKTKYDFIKYGAVRGCLLPIAILLATSVVVHSGSILYILNNISTPDIWVVIIEWSNFYLYLLPIIVFSPLLIIFVLAGALIEKNIYHEKRERRRETKE